MWRSAKSGVKRDSRLVALPGIRLTTIMLAMVLLIIAACAENGVAVEPTDPAQPGDEERPPATEVPATELPQPTAPPKVAAVTAPTATSTSSEAGDRSPIATATSTPEPPATLPAATPTDTPVPTAPSAPSPTPIPTSTSIPTPPPYHFASQAEAEASAIELGCTGWNQAPVDGVIYYRACASAELFETLVSASTNPGSDAEVAETPSPAPTVLPPTSTPTQPAQPTSTPIPQTPASTPTPPPYHYLTLAEADTAAIELGCTGFSKTVIDNTDYYRACAGDDAFEVYALGAPANLTGERCDLASDATVRFSAALTDLTQIASIVPAGSPSGGVIKPHSYLHNRDRSDGRNVRVPVYAVTDSVLSSVAYYGTTLSTSEYLIFFNVTCEISYKFDHITELAPKIAAVAPETPAKTTETISTPAITFEAGELIGYTHGAGGQGAWDFGVYDTTYTNQFANQQRYVEGHMGQLLHTVCPYDYFDEPLKSQMYALLGTHDQRLVPGLECTTSQRDVLGAAAGAWFETQVLEFSDARVAIAMLPGDIVAITGIGGDVRITKGQPTWLDPELLTTSHCYAGGGRWFFIEIQAEGMEMAIADGSGGCPGSLPASATVYYR